MLLILTLYSVQCQIEDVKKVVLKLSTKLRYILCNIYGALRQLLLFKEINASLTSCNMGANLTRGFLPSLDVLQT